jgi:hypothetical protein
VSCGRLPRARRVAVVLALVPVLTAGCGPQDDGPARAPAAASTASTPDGPEELEPLVVGEVPSGLPRLPDGEIDPPAGPKRLEDVAGYAADPDRERTVLREYGYRHGWERFWGTGTPGGPLTGVFVDRFDSEEGAAAYAEDLARNDADEYGGMLSEGAPDLPGGCHRLLVDEPRPEDGLSGPAAFAWCPHGVFSVSVSAVAGSVEAAAAEVRAVVADQVDRLPTR